MKTKDRYFHKRSICLFFVISKLNNLIYLRHKLLGDLEGCDDLHVISSEPDVRAEELTVLPIH